MRDIENMIADRYNGIRKSGYVCPKHAEMENILDRMMADLTADDSDLQSIYAVRDAIENIIKAMRDLEYRISPI